VALQPLAFARHARVFSGVLVVGQRDGAVLALQLFAAGAADHGEGIAAAVEQDQRLLAAIESGLRLLDERARKKAEREARRAAGKSE